LYGPEAIDPDLLRLDLLQDCRGLLCVVPKIRRYTPLLQGMQFLTLSVIVKDIALRQLLGL